MREILVVVVVLVGLYFYRVILEYEHEDEMKRIKKEHEEQIHNELIFYEDDLK